MLRLNKIYIFFGSSSFIAKELISKLKKDINWHPRISLEKGIKQLIKNEK